MSYFSTLLEANNIEKHNPKSQLWEYNINEKNLKSYLKNLSVISPEDAVLYFAYWWMNIYEGGAPTKIDVFNSLFSENESSIDYKEFFELACQGYENLNFQWIKKQNTLKFRSLLLQGGLPINVIKANEGKYKDFLQFVLDEELETVEELVLRSDITSILPEASRNEAVYASCLAITQSIQSGDDKYNNLSSKNELKGIVPLTKKDKTTKKNKPTKPKNYWIFDAKKQKIALRLGLKEEYEQEELRILLERDNAEKQNYKLFMNDELICIFRRKGNGKYKTDWFTTSQENLVLQEGIPLFHIIIDEEKVELQNFLMDYPDLDEPTLWCEYEESKWRFIKGNRIPNKKAAILSPLNWKDESGGLDFEIQTINNKQLNWSVFEGELNLSTDDDKKTFYTGVKSFEWLIESNKPKWMIKPNMTVVRGTPVVRVYDEKGYDVSNKRFNLFYKKYNSHNEWAEISSMDRLSEGCYHLKIQKGDLIAYDSFYNIGGFDIKYLKREIPTSEIELNNLAKLQCEINENDFIDVEVCESTFVLKLNEGTSTIPKSVKASIRLDKQKRLFFEFDYPFLGTLLIGNDGNIILENDHISITNLSGIRILCPTGTGISVKIFNKIKNFVTIEKQIKTHCVPLIDFKDDLERLFYLADAMNHENCIRLDLINGNRKTRYRIYGFNKIIDTENQNDDYITLTDSSTSLELVAIPVNNISNKTGRIILKKENDKYLLPSKGSFIIVSKNEGGSQVMPRFVSNENNDEFVSKEDRLKGYHNQLAEEGYSNPMWQEIINCFNICKTYEIPFSTFDQLRAIAHSSPVAAKAFWYLVLYQNEPDNFINLDLPLLEKDLGFCFHWVKKDDWGVSFENVLKIYGSEHESLIVEVLSGYFRDYLKYYGLDKMGVFIFREKKIDFTIDRDDVVSLKSQLGERIINELPKMAPWIRDEPKCSLRRRLRENTRISLLFKSPIAVAESIMGLDRKYSIWNTDENGAKIRKNIQYSQYINRDFYNKVIFHMISKKLK